MKDEIEKELTPAEWMGLKVGDKVRVIESGVFYTEGEVRTLVEDDRSNSPWFSPTPEQKRRGFDSICIALTFVEKLTEGVEVKDGGRGAAGGTVE